MRRRVAAAMLGEMLEDFRHFRDPDTRAFYAVWPGGLLVVDGPLQRLPPATPAGTSSAALPTRARQWIAVTTCSCFLRERGRMRDSLAPFRPGIGLLVKQTHAPVLPMAIVGLGELKARGRGWFRSGKIKSA